MVSGSSLRTLGFQAVVSFVPSFTKRQFAARRTNPVQPSWPIRSFLCAEAGARKSTVRALSFPSLFVEAFSYLV